MKSFSFFSRTAKKKRKEKKRYCDSKLKFAHVGKQKLLRQASEFNQIEQD